jgi:hypothetical protein
MGQRGDEDRKALAAFTHPARDHIMRILWDGGKLSATRFAKTGRESAHRVLYHLRVLERTTMIVGDEVAGDEHTDYTITDAGRTAFAPTTA